VTFRKLRDPFQPPIDASVFFLVAKCCSSPALQAGEAMQEQVASDRARTHLFATCPALQQATHARRSEKPTTSARGKRAGDFRDARLHELRDTEELIRRRANFLAHPCDTRRPRLELRHPDGVFKAHPKREASRARLRQCPLAIRRQTHIEHCDQFHSPQIEIDVARILIVEHSPRALEDKRL
jgi:hypothetical protein